MDAANLDFHLTANNTAIFDLGYDTTGQTYETLTDCDGETRSSTPDSGVDEYMVAASDSTPSFKVFNGSVFVTATPKVFNGSTWDAAVPNVYDGGDW